MVRVRIRVWLIIIIVIICYIYIALFWVLKAHYMEGGISSFTTSDMGLLASNNVIIIIVNTLL